MKMKFRTIAAVAICSTPLLAQASTNHSLKFAGKSFYLYQPAFNHCLAYAANLGKVTCDDSNPSRAISLFQFDHGKLRLIAPNNMVANSAADNLCLQIPSASNKMGVNTCTEYPNYRESQIFEFIEATGTAKGRYYIKSPYSANKCITYWPYSDSFTFSTCDNKEGQLFEITHTKDPVHIRMTNKAWLNLSFYIDTKNDSNQTNFHQKTTWAALNDTRHVLHPISGFSEHDDFEKVIIKTNTDNSKALVLPTALPGSVYNVEAHGTAFSTSLKYSLVAASEQLELFERTSYSGDRHLFSESQPNLLFLNNQVRSIKIPQNWTVRFYEGTNYTGPYYTRNGGQTLDASTLSKILSFEVLTKPEVVSLYDGNYYGGESFSFNQSQPTLLNFNDRMSSFKIPEGWEVRFYEGENFTGKYYTRNKSMSSDHNINNKIKSFEILKNPVVGLYEEIHLYDDYNYSGASVSFSESQPNLGNFNRRMSSFTLPDGWRVRFYEGTNYTGNYYTRDSSEDLALYFDNKIVSFEILEK